MMDNNKSAAAAIEEATNPFRRMQAGHSNAQPFSLVIFGATGDLTKRKLVPALFNLIDDGILTAPFDLIAFARREKSDDGFREDMHQALKKYSRKSPRDGKELEVFLHTMTYHRGSFENEEDFHALKKRIEECEEHRGGPRNRLFYMATPPEAFTEIIRNLHAVGLSGQNYDDDGWSRIIVEKPYGHDLESAWQLTGAVHASFDEEQIYRIDHYLGKETVQNILAFRLGNGIFEPLWNRHYIDHVQITVAETLGVENRAGYFDKAGIVRDMLQSHILQLFSLITMEPPVAFEAGYIRDEKVKLLRSVRPLDENHLSSVLVRGQYTAGSAGGNDVPGYRGEPGVPEDSKTDTFLALKLEIDNWRWAGVPFLIRTGKRLAKKVTEVDIVFRRPPHMIFKRAGVEEMHPNVLGIKIQPEEGIALSIGSKRPGQYYDIDPVTMEFNYATSFGVATPEAYERLLLDAILGDSTLFAREDEVELSWSLIDPILKRWDGDPDYPLAMYEAGSWGPKEATVLLARSGREWRRL